MEKEGSESSAVQQDSLIKTEVFVVSFWCLMGTLCLWGFDKAGLLSEDLQSVVVDFPEVYQIWKEEQAVFLDGRTTTAFDKGHIPGAISLPPGKVAQRLSLLPEDKGAPLIVYCSSTECPISYILLKRLQRHKYTNIQIFQRGIEGWQQFGYPLQKTVHP